MLINPLNNSKTQKNTFLNNIKFHLKDFCKNTAMHGFQYLEEPGRSLFERYWWFCVLIISYLCCFYAVQLTYEQWNRSPLIVNFASKGTPIYEIPFPSVTLCPEVKSGSKKFNYTKILHKKEDGLPLTPEEDKYFEYFSVLCDKHLHLKASDNYSFSEELFDVIDNLKPDIYIMNCSFFYSQSIDCKSLFIPILTEHGVCYSFNILNRSEFFRDTVLTYKNYHVVPQKATSWTIQDGYTESNSFNLYPYRAYLSGINKGLRLNIFTPHEDLDYGCQSPFQGYKVLLYTPMTIPRPSSKYFRLPLDRSVFAVVEPKKIETSAAVRKYNPKVRGCYFHQERFLKYFKYYTLNNCKMECVTNYTLHMCGCVNFFMPRENGTAICGSGKIRCMEIAEEIMQHARLEHKPKHIKTEFFQNCDCLPLCSDLTYQIETSQTTINWSKWTAARRTLQGIQNASISSLTVYFNDDIFIKCERNELYGPIDFLANFGGIIGLFTGVSLLSFVEIVYFLTIRLFCTVRMHRQ